MYLELFLFIPTSTPLVLRKQLETFDSYYCLGIIHNIICARSREKMCKPIRTGCFHKTPKRQEKRDNYRRESCSDQHCSGDNGHNAVCVSASPVQVLHRTYCQVFKRDWSRGNTHTHNYHIDFIYYHPSHARTKNTNTTRIH